jgi:sugar phosphate isomerase/epimerase
MPMEAAVRDFTTDQSCMALNTVTVRKQGDLQAIIDACLRHKIPAIVPWREQVAELGLRAASRAIERAGLIVPGYCRGGMMVADESRLGEARDDNRRAVDEAAELGAQCLVLVVGGLPQFSRPGSAPSKDIGAARALVADEIARLLPYAVKCGVRLALEPLHPVHAANRACVNTLGQALDLCDAIDQTGQGGLGVAVDVYHTWWDPDLANQIARAGAARLHAFHVCDWLVPTRDPLTDRGMMGDGVIDIPRIRGWIESAGYQGFCEVEILSDAWWARSMDDTLRACVRAMREAV